jgi:transposase
MAATRTFQTMTRDLEALRDWLKAVGVTHVGRESTGVYWWPVYTALEACFELIVGNAHHIRNVPGRKTDVKDAEWIADLVRHGLVAKSFVPPKPLRELRDLLRYRRKLIESQTAERNRLLKLLGTANIKLASVASDVFGVSGMSILKALIEGTATAEEMAAMALGEFPDSHDALCISAASNALVGRLDEAKEAVARLRCLDPALRVSNFREIMGPYRRPQDYLLYEEGMRRAGLPE